ncbi:MAG: hypothetical protein HZA54_16650, partial [Planctomycetes bacterium]|nr:hypothetical protein [Planctomycetota bacterium]
MPLWFRFHSALLTTVLLAFPAGAHAADPSPAPAPASVIVLFRYSPGDSAFTVDGGADAPDGTPVDLEVDLDRSRARGSPDRVRVEGRRFSARWSTGAACLLPGVYRVRARLCPSAASPPAPPGSAPPTAEACAWVRVGAPEEEAARRRAYGQWLAEC